MNRFLDLNTKAKLSVGFGLVLALMAVLITLAYASLNSARHLEDRIFTKVFAKLNVLDNIRADLNRQRSLALELAFSATPEERARLEGAAEEKAGLVTDEMAHLDALLEGQPERAAELAAIEKIYRESEAERKKLLELVHAGKLAEGQALILGVQGERNENMRSLALELDRKIKAEVGELVAISQGKSARYLKVFLIIGGLSLLLAIVVVALLNQAIANPLDRITQSAARIAGGDLTLALTGVERQDEVGRLQKAFASMVEGLRGLALDVSGGVNVLATTSSEILATTAQVASGAAQTASSISETSTTVDEVKQTAHMASQKAKSVSEGAQRAAQVAKSGRKAVEQSIEAMGNIREQIGMVAESTAKLGERSLSIGEIVETVNDLAEQSNILAVNAAIEAVRVGEAGKGFGVVAQEIRSLAEQSKQATTQVRTLLGEIQKGIGSAVMATEQVGKAVENGLKQSDEMGQSFRALADTVNDSAQAAIQIAASSQQQLVGMDQVGAAMEGIRKAGAQNLAGTKQSETAARNLHKLGQSLKEIVSRYKL